MERDFKSLKREEINKNSNLALTIVESNQGKEKSQRIE